MISERLDALSREDAELVVTALGSQRSFYLCWKTPDGRYHQGKPAHEVSTHLILSCPIPRSVVSSANRILTGLSQLQIAMASSRGSTTGCSPGMGAPAISTHSASSWGPATAFWPSIVTARLSTSRPGCQSDRN